jgi:hypothetical protein
MALLKGNKGDRIQNSAGLLLQLRVIRRHGDRNTICIVERQLLYHHTLEGLGFESARHNFFKLLCLSLGMYYACDRETCLKKALENICKVNIKNYL